MSSPSIELRPMGKSAPAPPVPPRHPAASNANPQLSDASPGSLGRAYRSAEDKARAVVHLQEGGMDAVSIWALGLAGWFTTLALPLLLFPRILLFFSQTPPTSAFTSASPSAREDHYDALSPLESTLCLSLSLGLLAMAFISVFILVPTYQLPSSNPSRTPLLGILVGLVTITGAVIWNVRGIGGLGQVVGAGNVIMAIWGWWVIVFGIGGKSKLTQDRKSKTPERFKKL
ncbi:uncharacterized protein IL334_004078 [Kwoniella shivajii]|uniref:Uncharacterized protein n=1 Tax=Kwoniella shivajii TaxID=564305 RepID=A0ABZ1D0L4_9TREE|nr:hypothetical protein IL334_004078 [Kwoniella shivajii]